MIKSKIYLAIVFGLLSSFANAKVTIRKIDPGLAFFDSNAQTIIQCGENLQNATCDIINEYKDNLHVGFRIIFKSKVDDTEKIIPISLHKSLREALDAAHELREAEFCS